MHSQWRLHRQFIMWTAQVVGNRQVIEDPNVSVFNVHRFYFLHMLTRACAEYVLEIAKTPGAESLDDPLAFIAKSEANVDFAWVCHFLYDAGFFVLDFLQSVRSNDSHKLDLLWREFFTSAHSGTANKTQYVPMAIMRVFWGCALTPELHELYHKIRTIPSGSHNGSGVGWDWAVEMLNAAIKSHVLHHVSDDRVQDFLANWALLETIIKHVRQASDGKSHQVNATADVNTLIKEFRKVIGTDWATATTARTNSQVTVGPQRTKLPWREVAEVARRSGSDATHAVVRRHVTQLTGFFPWA